MRLGFSVGKIVKSIDMFGANVPNLNMNGRSSIKTFTGACMSILMIFMATLFALLKLQFLLMRKSPDVVKFVDESAFDYTDVYNFDENDFMMAISVELFAVGARMDPRYV